MPARVVVDLLVDGAFAHRPLERFLAAHAVPGLSTHDAGSGTHARLVPAPGGPAHVAVRLGPCGASTELVLADASDQAHVEGLLRRWLDLDADPTVDVALAAHPGLAPLVAARPGLRMPGTTDGAETALLTVLGQQVSLAAARTFAARLVDAYAPAVDEGSGLRAFPDPAVLAAAGPEELQQAVGVTRARARCLHALAVALSDGLRLEPGADLRATRAALLALPGIGPWTAEYVCLRTLGDADAFPAEDLVLRRAMGVDTAREARTVAEAWRPWRGYALLHLWTAAVFV